MMLWLVITLSAIVIIEALVILFLVALLKGRGKAYDSLYDSHVETLTSLQRYHRGNEKELTEKPHEIILNKKGGAQWKNLLKNLKHISSGTENLLFLMVYGTCKMIGNVTMRH